MSKRFGVTVSYYGGASFKHAELTRELAQRDIPILEIRGCAYPEMARAEQVRQAIMAGVETLVFLDSSVDTNHETIVKLVTAAEGSGVSLPAQGEDWCRALDFAAVHRSVLQDMLRAETRRYSNSALVDSTWSGEKTPSVPLASPWHRDGTSLLDGMYLTDSEAFLFRAARSSGSKVHRLPVGSGARFNQKPIRTRIVNENEPITHHPGSRFALCIPTFGTLDLDQQNAIYQLEKAGMTVVQLHDCPWIDQGRSWLTEQAMALGKGVFFLDHDILFMPNDVLRLCEQALERNAVVAGPYSMRRSGRSIIGAFDLPPGPINFFKHGATYPAYYSGLGFAAIPYDVLNSIALPELGSFGLEELAGGGVEQVVRIRPWYALDCSTGFYAGEDVSFCNRVHDLTVRQLQTEPGEDLDWEMTHSGRPARVFLDTRVRIAHRGSYDYGIEDVGIVVPRCEELEAQMFTSRAEARKYLVKADALPTDLKLDMLDFQENASHPKAEALVLDEEGVEK